MLVPGPWLGGSHPRLIGCHPDDLDKAPVLGYATGDGRKDSTVQNLLYSLSALADPLAQRLAWPLRCFTRDERWTCVQSRPGHSWLFGRVRRFASRSKS